MDLEQTAIQRLRAASEMALQVYKTPLVITDSGGKDSSICTHIAERAGIPFEVMHNHTTADAPETVYFIRKKFQHFEDKGIKCAVNMPRLQRKAYLHVEPDPAKAHATDPAHSLLLFCIKRTRRERTLYHNGRSLGRVGQAEK